ncbi:MAG: hypothetical protein Q8P84_02630 [Deltaproteobacteria bacterium]|nr:hypothetical protein [Deltaproteobacteria bacterium]
MDKLEAHETGEISPLWFNLQATKSGDTAFAGAASASGRTMPPAVVIREALQKRLLDDLYKIRPQPENEGEAKETEDLKRALKKGELTREQADI